MLNVVDWEKTNIYLLNKTCLSSEVGISDFLFRKVALLRISV